MKKYLITASLLNSWKYAISPDNEYGTLEDFKNVLAKVPFEPTEAIMNGFKFEQFMMDNYELTKNGCYQVKLSKNITTKTGSYVLYGILECLKAGTIYEYFVKLWLYPRYEYISLKNIKDIHYRPNFFTNHWRKDDLL